MPSIATCARIELKPNSIGKVRAWATFLNDHKDEALATLQAEGVTIESAFLDSNDHGDFLIYYMRSESPEKAAEVAARSVEAIDVYHRNFKKETWSKLNRLELLIDLTT